jgi:hypothetical protein
LSVTSPEYVSTSDGAVALAVLRLRGRRAHHVLAAAALVHEQRGAAVGAQLAERGLERAASAVSSRARDAEQPRAQLLGLAQRGQAAVRAHERLLQGLVRGGAVAQHVAEEAVDHRRVAVVDRAKRAHVAGRGTGHERALERRHRAGCSGGHRIR